MSDHVLPPLTVNSKSERKVNSLPLLEFEPVIFGMLAHLSNHSAKSHPPMHGEHQLLRNIHLTSLCNRHRHHHRRLLQLWQQSAPMRCEHILQRKLAPYKSLSSSSSSSSLSSTVQFVQHDCSKSTKRECSVVFVSKLSPFICNY
jgi:hypothetical protein